MITEGGRGYTFGEAPEAFDFSGELAPGETVVAATLNEAGTAAAAVTSAGNVLTRGDAPHDLGSVDLAAWPAGAQIVGIAFDKASKGVYVGNDLGGVVALGTEALDDWTDEGLLERITDFEPAFPSPYKEVPADLEKGAFYGVDAQGGTFTAYKGGNAHLVVPFWHSLWFVEGFGDLRDQLRAPVKTLVVIQPDCDYELPRYFHVARDGGEFHTPGKAKGDEGYTAYCGSGVSYYEETLGHVPAVGSVPDFIDGQQWGRYCSVLLREDGLIVVNGGNDPVTQAWTPEHIGDARALLVPGDRAVSLLAHTPTNPQLASYLGIDDDG